MARQSVACASSAGTAAMGPWDTWVGTVPAMAVRGPGVSLVAATQRPGALPATAISQADLLVVHRLTGRADREALVIDDATETVNTVTVRERLTPHDGASPRASARVLGPSTDTDIETVE